MILSLSLSIYIYIYISVCLCMKGSIWFCRNDSYSSVVLKFERHDEKVICFFSPILFGVWITSGPDVLWTKCLNISRCCICLGHAVDKSEEIICLLSSKLFLNRLLFRFANKFMDKMLFFYCDMWMGRYIQFFRPNSCPRGQCLECQVLPF